MREEGRREAGRTEPERPRVGEAAGAAGAAGRTGEGVRELGRTEPERPRVGTGAGLAERASCARRARNSCCSGVRPAEGAADEL